MSDTSLASLASPDVLARARKIKLLLMDVDGTLTDGGVCLISTTVASGSAEPAVSEMKVFDAHDGQGLLWLTPWESRRDSLLADNLRLWLSALKS